VVKESIDFFMNNQGDKPVDYFHKRLGNVMWEKCGMARNAKGLTEAIKEIKEIRAEFYKNVRVPGKANGTNQELEKALRVADFLELGELMCRDALMRNESCGGHFREEYVEVGGEQDGEAKRDDENFAFVGAWEFNSVDEEPTLHKEELNYENIKMTQRSYK
jgi:succinate dehydrogenase / fumarate reductase flavoprotein subunit